MGNLQKFIRGQVWWQKSTLIRQPGIQNDGRPVIIISNNACNRFSPAITVIPLTTADKKPLPTHVKILMEDSKISTALCEQLRTISTELLEDYIGTLDDTKLTEIEGAILITLGFKQPEIQKEIEQATAEHKPEKIAQINKVYDKKQEENKKRSQTFSCDKSFVWHRSKEISSILCVGNI